MGKKLYVGNLSFDVDDQTLEQLFTAYGTVESANVINDRNTGQSKGFGFVEMSSNEEAKAAISGLDGKEHGGRTLKVNEAKPREDRSGGEGHYQRNREHYPKDCVYNPPSLENNSYIIPKMNVFVFHRLFRVTRNFLAP